ncbi:MAG: hypothetical protein AAFX40_20015, partial [Cyanobacteria bacterium J06639_1]
TMTSGLMNAVPAATSSSAASLQSSHSQGRADDIVNWLQEYGRDRVNSRLIDERRCIPPHIVLDFGVETGASVGAARGTTRRSLGRSDRQAAIASRRSCKYPALQACR